MQTPEMPFLTHYCLMRIQPAFVHKRECIKLRSSWRDHRVAKIQHGGGAYTDTGNKARAFHSAMSPCNDFILSQCLFTLLIFPNACLMKYHNRHEVYSTFLQSCVDFAATLKPEGMSAVEHTTTPWHWDVFSVIVPSPYFNTWFPYRKDCSTLSFICTLYLA